MRDPIKAITQYIERDRWRELPSWIKTPLLFIYKLYIRKFTLDFIVDKELLKYLIEFYNHDQGYKTLPLNFKDGIKMLEISWRFVNDLWKLQNPSTDDEIRKFYETQVTWYIFDIARTHMLRHDRRFKKKVINECRGNILDYGGGIGDLSAKLAEKGHNVTYVDVPSKTMEFAKWYFSKKGLDIKIIAAGKNFELPESYDTIICIEVIEHLTNPKEILLMLSHHLKEEGRLIITQLDCLGSTDSNPMHFKIDFNDAEQFLNSLGVYKSDHYPWLWIKR